MYENFVGTWDTVRNREVSVLERCPHGEVRLQARFPYNLWDRQKSLKNWFSDHDNPNDLNDQPVSI